MSGKMTFVKVKVQVNHVTDDAAKCKVRINTGRNIWAPDVWIPRSNMRSDDDRRMNEVQAQLESVHGVNTFLQLAEWWVRSRGWLPTVNENTTLTNETLE